MSKKDLEIEEGKEVVGRTIVGGRPRCRKKRKLRIPIGIEKVLCRAAGDDSFRRALMHNRAETLGQLKDSVGPTELDILATIPDETLGAMIDGIDLKRHSRRKFMRGVVAATFVTAAATTFVDCDGVEDQGKGIQPGMGDADVQTEEIVSPDFDTRGIGPDADFEDALVLPDEQGESDAKDQPDVVEVDALPAPTGIQPDSS